MEFIYDSMLQYFSKGKLQYTYYVYLNFKFKQFMIYFTTISIHSQASSITMFNGLNFYEWSEQVNFRLGILDLDLSVLEEKLVITINSTEEEKSKLKA